LSGGKIATEESILLSGNDPTGGVFSGIRGTFGCLFGGVDSGGRKVEIILLVINFRMFVKFSLGKTTCIKGVDKVKKKSIRAIRIRIALFKTG